MEPLSVTKHLPGHPDEASTKGRIVTLEFPNTFLVGTYVVNAGEKLKVNATSTFTSCASSNYPDNGSKESMANILGNVSA
jgi:hypothetical protein